MMIDVQTPTSSNVERSEKVAGECHAPMRVWMYDPWCRTPWYTASLTRALLNCDVRVRLVAPRYHLEPQFFQQQGLVSMPGPFDLSSRGSPNAHRLWRAARVAEYLGNTAALSMAARRNGPQILHQQQCVLLERGIKLELRFLRWCQRNGICVIHTVHNLLPHSEKSTRKDLFAQLYHSSDALICHSIQSANQLESQFAVESKRIHIVPHGPLFADGPVRSRNECGRYLHLDPDRQVMLFQGVIRPYKGADILLHAWKKLLKQWQGGRPPFLLIAGLGSESDHRKLRHITDSLGLSRRDVRLDLRYIPAHSVSYYFGAADVLLYPYRDITTSGALLTGLNYCKPIIASDLAPFREYLSDGVNARLVPPEDINALAAALSALAGDEETYRKLLSGSSRNRDLQSQWSEIGSRTTAVYRSVLG